MRLLAATALSILLCSPALAQQRTQYVLAINWQPAFCETRPNRPECETQTPDRFDAANFTLHGLWPQPRSRDYCGVDAQTVMLDEDGDWDSLPEVELSAGLRNALDERMPGTQSALEKHEWTTHGTCYGTDAEEYFSDAIDMLDVVNDGAVQQLFAGSTGKTVTQQAVRAAFDRDFGAGAGQRVRLACVDDGNRRLISELTIGLTGNIDGPDSFAGAIMAARPTDGGCDSGIVDPVGLQ